MILKLKKSIAQEIGLRKFSPFGVNEDSWAWKSHAEIDLGEMSEMVAKDLRKILFGRKDIHGVGVMVKDVDTWIGALQNKLTSRPRTCQQFCSLLAKYLSGVPHHWVYRRHENEGVFLPYYVNEVEYHPPYKSRGDYTPAYTNMEIIWEEFGGKQVTNIQFYDEDVRGRTVVESLARKRFYAETPELVSEYREQVQRFSSISNQIGKQYVAVGTGTDDLDGNPSGRDDSWYWRRTNTVQLVREGNPTRMVVDVFYEEDKSDRREKHVHIKSWFWKDWLSKPRFRSKDEEKDDDEDSKESDDERAAVEDVPEVEIPIHPFLAMFDLSKHLRLRVHVQNLTEYVYDETLSEKLVLRQELKDLIKMLIEHKAGTFRDIVKGKSGGAVILLAGPPGVGKTLTAEVYAESEKRALYSVQCSQLGTDPDVLEDSLLKIFARAHRWDAVLLLDEADVYVHERGNNMDQNAIVGVFLRVLEYQGSVMFLTTNRPDDVDDAILSRCIARLNYECPSPEEQKQIWRVLASNSGVSISESNISKITHANPQLSGRDVKNLLKLGMMFVKSRGHGELDLKIIEFVKRFKPTGPSDGRNP